MDKRKHRIVLIWAVVFISMQKNKHGSVHVTVHDLEKMGICWIIRQEIICQDKSKELPYEHNHFIIEILGISFLSWCVIFINKDYWSDKAALFQRKKQK